MGGLDKAKDSVEPKDTKSFTSVSDNELHSLKDRAHLFDLIYDAPCYVTFFTGSQGQGAALRENMIVPNRDHNDNTLYNMAMRKAKKLGATSWMVFKPIGVPHDVEYGRYGDESRLDFIEAVNDLVVTDPSANWDAANPPKDMNTSKSLDSSPLDHYIYEAVNLRMKGVAWSEAIETIRKNMARDYHSRIPKKKPLYGEEEFEGEGKSRSSLGRPYLEYDTLRFNEGYNQAIDDMEDYDG